MFAGKDFVASKDRSGFTGLRQKTLLLPSTEPVVQGCMTTLHQRFTCYCSRLYSLPCEQLSSVSRYFSTRNHGFGSLFCARWQIFCCFHEQKLFSQGYVRDSVASAHSTGLTGLHQRSPCSRLYSLSCEHLRRVSRYFHIF